MVSQRIKGLREKAAGLPLRPGVYLMKDSSGTVIYVGKSRKLKNRVSSYFVDTDHGIKTTRMVSRVADFDFILCDTEMEALTLENVLIKQYEPRYNIKLKDAKSYPYIKIPVGSFPIPEVTRHRKPDGGMYFGPYRSASMAREALDTVNSIFALPSCKHQFPKETGKIRPCLYRQMGRCCAPCAPDITESEYHDLIISAKKIFEGNTKEAESELTRRMYDASDRELFELAAHYRNSIDALRQLSEKQKVVTSESDERDVFALWEGETCNVLAVLQIRGGKLLYKNDYIFEQSELTGTSDIMTLLADYYCEALPPKEVLLDRAVENEAVVLLSDYLSQKAGRRVTVRTPVRGPLKKLCDMARDMASQRAEVQQKSDRKNEKALVRLSALLGLEVFAERIEAYDISNLGNEAITCSMVVFENGEPKRSDYRTFKIKATEGTDDYGAMREALMRRLSHIGDGTASLGETPDLILLDGGVGHVHTVLPLTKAISVPIPTFGMVKDDFHKTRCLTDGDQEISIANETAVYRLIFSIQEEAHRVAVRAMMTQKRKTLKHSSLEKIPGIGPAKAALLLREFGSFTALQQADRKTLLSIKGISDADTAQILSWFSKKKTLKTKKPHPDTENKESKS